MTDAPIRWLLDSDPALRWQVERDLAGARPAVWQATRARIATEGLGARLLALQDEDGQWAGGAYFPAGFDWNDPDPADEGGQPYLATTWSLSTLREWELDASVLDGTAEKLAANSRWEYDDLPYWGGEVDACINAFTLANGAWLGADVSSLAGWFVEHQVAEGGSARRRCGRARLQTSGLRMRWRSFARHATRMVRGIRGAATRGGCGSRSTRPWASRRSG